MKEIQELMTLSGQFKVLKKVKYFLYGLVVLQLAGGLAMAGSGISGLSVINIWIGMAIASFPGVIAGYYWQRKKEAESISENGYLIAFLGLMGVLVSGMGLVVMVLIKKGLLPI